MEQKEAMVQDHARKLIAQVRRVVVGKDQVLLWVTAAILARGHILLEDIPGVGKTPMALPEPWVWTIAGCSLRRMCCPPM